MLLLMMMMMTVLINLITRRPGVTTTKQHILHANWKPKLKPFSRAWIRVQWCNHFLLCCNTLIKDNCYTHRAHRELIFNVRRLCQSEYYFRPATAHRQRRWWWWRLKCMKVCMLHADECFWWWTTKQKRWDTKSNAHSSRLSIYGNWTSITLHVFEFWYQIEY